MMRSITRLWAMLLSMAALCPCMALAADPPDPVKKLIAQLGAPEQAARDDAEARLVAMGIAVRPALLQATGSADLEIKVRATRAVDALRIQTARSQTLWNTQVAALPSVNLVAAHIGNRTLFYHSDGTSITVHEATSAMPPPMDWSLRLPGIRINSLVLAGDRILVTGSDYSLICLDAATLKTLWTCDAEKDAVAAKNPGGAANPPVVAAVNGNVVMIRGGVGNGAAAAAVEQRVIISGRGPSQVLPSLCRPTVDAGVAYVAGTANLYAIDLATGQPLWSQPLPAGIIGSPAVSEDRVYVATGSSIASFRRKTGQPDSIIENVDSYSGPLVTKDAVIASQMEGLVAYDIHDGHILWHNPDSTLLVEVSAGRFAVSARPTEGRVCAGMNPPVLENGTILFSSMDTMFSVNPATGESRWKWQPSPLPAAGGAPAPVPAAKSILLAAIPVISSMAFDGDDAIVSTNQGIFAINTKVGLSDWEFHPANTATQTTSINTVYLAPVIADGIAEFYVTVREAIQLRQVSGAVVNSTTIANRTIGMNIESVPQGMPKDSSDP